MAKAPLSEEALKEQFGPHLKYVPPGGWKDESIHPAEKLVKTHVASVASNAAFNSRS